MPLLLPPAPQRQPFEHFRLAGGALVWRLMPLLASFPLLLWVVFRQHRHSLVLLPFIRRDVLAQILLPHLVLRVLQMVKRFLFEREREEVAFARKIHRALERRHFIAFFLFVLLFLV